MHDSHDVGLSCADVNGRETVSRRHLPWPQALVPKTPVCRQRRPHPAARRGVPPHNVLGHPRRRWRLLDAPCSPAPCGIATLGGSDENVNPGDAPAHLRLLIDSLAREEARQNRRWSMRLVQCLSSSRRQTPAKASYPLGSTRDCSSKFDLQEPLTS